MIRWVIALAIVFSRAAMADNNAGAGASADLAWHAGLDLRADLGAHPIRAGGGIQVGKWDTTLILDPMFWTDGQHDLDLFETYSVADGGWGPLFGWRTSLIPIQGGTEAQEKAIVGVGANLPSIKCLRIHWQFEAALLVVKHGGDLPTGWVSFASGRDFIDLINFGMFVTVEYGRKI